MDAVMARGLVGDKTRDEKECVMGMYREEVERGAAFLDKKHAGWREQIDLKRLQLSKCTTCVLGQLVGGDEPRWEWVLHSFGIYEDTGDDVAMGFNIDDDTPENWGALTAEWRDYIRETRSGVSA